MEAAGSAPVPSRKELRKQKLMEYLAAKGKLKPPTVTPSLHLDCQGQKPEKSSLKVLTGKENKTSAVKFKYQSSKSQTLIPQSRQEPVRRAFSVSNAVNVRGDTEKGKKNAVGSSSSRAPTQLKRNQNPLLTKTYTVEVSKSNMTAASSLKNPTDTRGQTSGKASSSTASTVGAKSSFKSSLNSNCATAKTASSRISMGPLVKTKTGLTPAVILPRHTKSDMSRPHAPTRKPIATASVVAKKVQSSSAASASARQKSAGGKVQAQNKSEPKPPLDKRTLPARKNLCSGGPRVTTRTFKGKAPPVRAEGRALPSKPAGQSADKSVQVASGAAPQTTSRTNRCSSTTGSRLKKSAVTELAGKSKTSKETSSAKIPTPRALPKRTIALVKSQTAPQPSRSISITGRATATKKVVPQTEGKQKTTAQEARLKQLQEWREAKGISYKRPPMQVKSPVRCAVSISQPFWATMNVEEEARSLICSVDRALADCLKLLAEGCPADQVKPIFSRLPPLAQKFAKYWICRARLMEQEGNLDVLPVFEEAVRVVLEPVDELRSVVFDILKKKDEIQAREKQEDVSSAAENTPDGTDLLTPNPIKVLINGERGDSSVVKYKITKTPGGPPSQHRDPIRVHGHEVRFFTPVRRSVRIERTSLQYPASLQDHDLCVASYNDLIAEEDNETSDERKSGRGILSANDPLMYVYRENEALGDKVSLRLVYEDPV